MAVSPEERKFLLSQVNRLAERDLNSLWTRAAELPNVDFAAFVIRAFPVIADPFVEIAGQLAATWFELSAPASPYVAVVAPPIPEEKLLSSARWALGASGDAGRDRLEGTLQRAVFDGSRNTTILNVERTRSKWARHASANACAFCRLMSIRGAVYNSQTTAAADFHDHDRCIAVEDRDGTYESPGYVAQWQDEYDKARANSGSGDPNKILAAWRSQAAEIK
jgi:hypothetical protein